MMRERVKQKVWMYLKEKLDFFNYVRLRSAYRTITSRVDLPKECCYYQKRGRSKKKYFIIRNSYPTMGLMAAARHYIQVAYWAETKGYIPLLDLEDEYTQLYGEIGNNCIWESIFETPISVEKAIENGICVYGTINHMDMDNYGFGEWLNGDRNDIRIHLYAGEYAKTYYSKIGGFASKYILFNNKLVDYFMEKYGAKFADKKRILGVCLREHFTEEGRSYIENEEHRKVLEYHPVNPSVEDSLIKIKELFVEWECDAVFLTTTVEATITRFTEVFGEELIYVDRKRDKTIEKASQYGGRDFFEIDEIEARRLFLDIDSKKREQAYALEIMGLSKCHCFVGHNCGGSIMANVFNAGKFEQTFIFTEGNEKSGYK